MPTIIDYYEYAKLASASYVDLDGKPLVGANVALQANEQERLPLDLANQTFDPSKSNGLPVWTIPSGGYYGNDPEGFAATFFQRTNSDGSIEKVLAIRGTEPDFSLSGDLLKADIGQIGFLGLALGQAVSMVNYIRRLQAPDGSAVQQLEWHTSTTQPTGLSVALPDGKGWLYFTDTTTRPGLGLINSGEKITVTGHSLGGHLAGLAGRLFPDLVKEAYTYNAPGFDPETVNVLGSLLALLNPEIRVLISLTGGVAMKLTGEFVDLLGNYLPTPPAASFALATIHNLESEDLDPVNDPSLVASIISGTQVYGEETFVTTERNSHLIEPLMDSLALQALISRMNPALKLPDVSQLLNAASNNIADTQEMLLETLYKTIKGSEVSLTPTVDALYDDPVYGLAWIGSGNIVGRRDYYAKLVELENIVKAKPDLHLEIVVGSSRNTLVSKAQQTDAEGLAYRYALTELNPFAINGDPALYSSHNANGELDLHDPDTGQGQLTKLYLQDRAAMLGWKMKYDVGAEDEDDLFTYGDRADKPYSEEWSTDRISGDWNLKDLGSVVDGSPLELFINGKGTSIFTVDPNHQIVFGSSKADVISGEDTSDHLYGMAGDDGLTGNEGNDYLEGGPGFDSYVINPGDGFDTVLDVDGAGLVLIAGINAKGSAGLDPKKWTKLSDNTWADTLNDITYSKSIVAGETRLLIRKGDATVLVKGWNEGELGIALGEGALRDAPATSLTIEGDRQPEDWDSEASGVQLGYDDLQNILVTDTPEPGREDTLYDGTANDHLLGHGGDDYLYAHRGGDNLLEGGDGSDIVVSLDGNDLLFGGSQTALDAAIIQGETQAGSGQRGDWVSAHKGADILAGDAGDDVLLGGEGEDLMIGGGGNDNLYGDHHGYAYRGWTLTRSVQASGGVDFYSTQTVDAETFESATGAADVIHGGAGDDWIQGNQGNDIIDAGADNDVVFGGEGADVILGQGGNDRLHGNAGAQSPQADGADYIDGGEGDDQLSGAGGADLLLGGSGNDTLYGDGNGTPEEDEGDDILDGGAGADYLAGGGGNDTYLNVTGEDTVFDNLGNNTIQLAAAGIGNGGLGASVETNSSGQPYMQLQIELDTGGTLKLDDPFAASGTTILQFANGDEVDVETLVGERLHTPLHLRSLDSGGRGYGGAADDTLTGGAGSDTLLGYAGHDSLKGGAGGDVLAGGAGNDYLMGDETEFFLAGALHGSDALDGGEGDDFLSGGGGGDTLTGGEGDDWLYGDDSYELQVDAAWHGNDFLYGGAGNDRVEGGGGNDVLEGGTGDDELAGGEGRDVFRFNLGDGKDRIDDGADSAVTFGAGVELQDFRISRTAYGYRIAYSQGGDAIDVPLDWARSSGRLQFADGSYVLSDEVLTAPAGVAVQGDADDDILVETRPDARFEGGGGDDVLLGGAGANDYAFNWGDGADKVVDLGGMDTVRFGPGITPDDVRFEYDDAGDGLPAFRLSIGDAGDSIAIRDGEQGAIERFAFDDGTVLSFDGLAALRGFAPPVTTPAGGVYLYQENALVLGTAGDDVLEDGDVGDVVYAPGPGNDALEVYAGENYHYLLSEGDGHDTLANDAHSRNETLVFGEGITPQSLAFEVSLRTVSEYSPWTQETYVHVYRDLTVHYGGLDDTLYIPDGAGESRIERLLFANGEDVLLHPSAVHAEGTYALADFAAGSGVVTEPVWIAPGPFDIPAIPQARPTVYWEGTAADDVYRARDALGIDGQSPLPQADFADGGAGDDIIATLAGNDLLAGGIGDDLLEGGSGSDVYVFSDGDGRDVIRDAADAGERNYVQIASAGTAVPEFNYEDGDLLIRYNGGADEIRVENFYAAGTDDGAAISGLWLHRTDPYAFSNEDVYYSLADIKTAVAIQSGSSGADVLTGTGRSDALFGGLGADEMRGGLGDDTYHVDDPGDKVIELANQGWDSVVSTITYKLPSHVEALRLSGALAVNATGNALDNVLTGNDEGNTLNGGAGADTLIGGPGGDVYVVDHAADRVIEQAGLGIDLVKSSVDFALPEHAENLTLTGSAHIMGTGNALDNSLLGNGGGNYLSGLGGSDVLRGNGGNDILQAGTENDYLYGGLGANLLDGGAGDDALTGGAGNELFIGGAGADTIATGTGADVIAFNRGDGADTVSASVAADNALSLGGGLEYAQLSLSRSGYDLLLNAGEGDQITFKNWYRGNRSVVTLQVVLDGSADYQPGGTELTRDNLVETFDFGGIVSAFDAARASNPALSSWALSNALANFHVSGSDSEALGGDLAYQYAASGNLAQVGLTAAQSVLSDAVFGTAPQALKALASLQEGAVRLA